MKKIRYFPFGYHMTNGKIEIVPGEAELLRLITARYLEGWSLLRLAGMAEQSGIPYRENAHDWNKNVIARILDDVRYWNGESYPPVFSRELGEQIAAMRRRKAIPQSSSRFLYKKLVCCRCGTSLNRNSKKSPRIYWDCKTCETRIGPLDDEALLTATTERLLTICRNPQMAEPEQTTGDSLSMQAARLTNEINQALNQREVNPQRLLPLILECAAEKYKTCRIQESDHITMKISALFQEHGHDEKLDRNLFEQTVEQVILKPDGTVQLRLLNGKVL